MGFLYSNISSQSSVHSKRSTASLETVQPILDQVYAFESALKAMDLLFMDKADEGIKLIQQNLKKPQSLPSKMILNLGNGVIHFLEATLGFEPEKIKKAQECLKIAEDLSTKSEHYNQQNKIYTSDRYPPGLECKVAYIESCLLGALLMLFNESYVDTIKALYKLKKAYSALSSVNKLVQKKKGENTYLTKHNEDMVFNTDDVEDDELLTSSDYSEYYEEDESFSDGGASIDTFYSCLDSPHLIQKKFTGWGNLEGSTLLSDSSYNDLEPSDIPLHLLKQIKNAPNDKPNKTYLKKLNELYQMREDRLRGRHINDSFYKIRKNLGDPQEKHHQKKFFPYLNTNGNVNNTIDEFIESSAGLCYGIIQLILSILPPAVTSVLNAFGFNINKMEGLQLLWDVVNERNIFSGLSLGTLVIYYHGPFKFIDNNFNIPIKDKKVESLIHPGHKLDEMILKATYVFPDSSLWILQEAIVLSSKGELKKALDVINQKDIQDTKMLQIKAQLVFCRALLYCFNFDYEKAAEDFIYLLEINEWSHAFYTYFAGCCYLEAYRICTILERSQDEPNKQDPERKLLKKFSSDNSTIDLAKKDYYKKKCLECMERAPTLLHTKTFMSNNLPFDKFMLRKLKQFKSIQSKLGSKVDFINSIPSSPVLELTYLYDGFNRMNSDQLRFASVYLVSYENPAMDLNIKNQENLNIFLRSTIAKNMKNYELANSLLKRELLPQIYDEKKQKFIKLKDDPWLYPSVFYELALINWNLKGMDALPRSIEYLKQSLHYMNDYELSSRIGMKSQAALNRCQNK
ncbi:related to Mitochondrial outer membrane protein IML2 [Hanseniaspora guilliermondii]|uniref:Related to Mitochondrial outer membrane protein IML2 n=1 Tax=Hanseniaspora guilliermondii TaxID=56406 RepID=A0A1L0FN96_9ASCO|nr:related to Mitochondrial outer membrane protein IML2 [Hanseniaspora guilliermondii]